MDPLRELLRSEGFDEAQVDASLPALRKRAGEICGALQDPELAALLEPRRGAPTPDDGLAPARETLRGAPTVVAYDDTAMVTVD